MFRPKDAMVHVESRARDQARWAIRDHGADAEAVIRAKLARPGAAPGDRYRYKLTLREIARLRRRDPDRYGAPERRGLLQRLGWARGGA